MVGRDQVGDQVAVPRPAFVGEKRQRGRQLVAEVGPPVPGGPDRLRQQHAGRGAAAVQAPAHGVLEDLVGLAEIVPAGGAGDGRPRVGVRAERLAQRFGFRRDVSEVRVERNGRVERAQPILVVPLGLVGRGGVRAVPLAVAAPPLDGRRGLVDSASDFMERVTGAAPPLDGRRGLVGCRGTRAVRLSRRSGRAGRGRVGDRIRYVPRIAGESDGFPVAAGVPVREQNQPRPRLVPERRPTRGRGPGPAVPAPPLRVALKHEGLPLAPAAELAEPLPGRADRHRAQFLSPGARRIVVGRGEIAPEQADVRVVGVAHPGRHVDVEAGQVRIGVEQIVEVPAADDPSRRLDVVRGRKVDRRRVGQSGQASARGAQFRGAVGNRQLLRVLLRRGAAVRRPEQIDPPHVGAVAKLRVPVGAPEALDQRRPGRDLRKQHGGGDVDARLDGLRGDDDAPARIVVFRAGDLLHLPPAVRGAEARVYESQDRRRLRPLRDRFLEGRVERLRPLHAVDDGERHPAGTVLAEDLRGEPFDVRRNVGLFRGRGRRLRTNQPLGGA